jgi:hypothetical protein
MLRVRRFSERQNVNSSINLKVLANRNEEEEYAVEQEVGEIVDGVFQLKKNYISQPQKCILPSFATKSFLGTVTHVEHCNLFYVHESMQERPRYCFP